MHYYFGELVTWRSSGMRNMESSSRGRLTCNSLAIYVQGFKLIELFHRYGCLWSSEPVLELVEVRLYHHVYGLLLHPNPAGAADHCQFSFGSSHYTRASRPC